GGVDALKASMAHGKKNLVANWVLMVCLGLPMTAVMIVLGIVISILASLIHPIFGILGLAFPLIMLIYMPIYYAALWLAYEDNKADIHAAAAEAGITIA
ncbi:hypothetical protein HY251_11295, partial [bacterium]|nr:hypothetical protein [bacterium]